MSFALHKPQLHNKWSCFVAISSKLMKWPYPWCSGCILLGWTKMVSCQPKYESENTGAIRWSKSCLNHGNSGWVRIVGFAWNPSQPSSSVLFIRFVLPHLVQFWDEQLNFSNFPIWLFKVAPPRDFPFPPILQILGKSLIFKTNYVAPEALSSARTRSLLLGILASLSSTFRDRANVTLDSNQPPGQYAT